MAPAPQAHGRSWRTGVVLSVACRKDPRLSTSSHTPSDRGPSAVRAMIELFLGPGKKRTMLLTGEEPVTIGRDPANSLAFNDDELSRCHGVIEKVGSTYMVRDFQSRNGTLLNGRLVQEVPLASGDWVQMGRVKLRFILRPVTAAGTASGTSAEMAIDWTALAPPAAPGPPVPPAPSTSARPPLPVSPKAVDDSSQIGVVIVDHGSRRVQANRMLEQFVERFACSSPYRIVEPAHMELAEPSIATAFGRCAACQVRLVVVVPYFLLPGRHWAQDIASLTAAAAQEHGGVAFLVGAPIGLHPMMAEVIRSRLDQCLAHAAGSAPECESCRGTGHCRIRQPGQDGA